MDDPHHDSAASASGDATGRTAVVVYNPVKIDAQLLESMVRSAADAHQWGEVRFVETTEDDPGYGQAREAVEAGASMVVACGGDGTVRSVAAGVRGSAAALGIIPAGTGNLLVRNLKLPLDQPRAAEVVFGGQDDAMDICVAQVTRPDGSTEEIDFVVMAGVGIDAQMILNTDDTLKKHIGFLAYGIAILKSLRGGNRIKILHRMDQGREYRTSVHSVIVGNCGELMGNIALLPDAKADDGLLDVVAMQPKGIFGWFQIFGRLLRQAAQKFAQKARKGRRPVTGTNQDLKSLQYVTGTSFEVTLSAPEDFEVDGDEAGRVTAFTVTVDHLGLKVRVDKPAPPEHPGEPRESADLAPGYGVEHSDLDEPAE
ncbi:diacylglycerol/lipid kinase family protein [Corynebacterium guangdongense]|uniref:Diacylglycerol kinase family enzyme n=1 Tax=Corynebacterium guangdongense TaxID=1783348 RepID=A0ABU1ZWK1_9CORY|nr:diacylglycerol kinase family protein [Corynebacterium guangdongense]MDR7329291.1 diacylglycerol kinase family enzyme [Corynebacterium guangdongense]WJZ17857.1 Putative lipid kinase BmrU [Corynebacterium guangdongense]